MAEQPIGRIEYLNRDGTVSSSWEFTKAKELEAVAWRNYDYDISSRIVAYRNQEGKTIPLDFLNDIEPPTPLCILDYAQWQKADKFYRLREEKLQREKELAAQLRAVQKQERSARQNLRDSSRKSAENAR